MGKERWEAKKTDPRFKMFQLEGYAVAALYADY